MIAQLALLAIVAWLSAVSAVASQGFFETKKIHFFNLFQDSSCATEFQQTIATGKYWTAISGVTKSDSVIFKGIATGGCRAFGAPFILMVASQEANAENPNPEENAAVKWIRYFDDYRYLAVKGMTVPRTRTFSTDSSTYFATSLMYAFLQSKDDSGTKSLVLELNSENGNIITTATLNLIGTMPFAFSSLTSDYKDSDRLLFWTTDRYNVGLQSNSVWRLMRLNMLDPTASQTTPVSSVSLDFFQTSKYIQFVGLVQDYVYVGGSTTGATYTLPRVAVFDLDLVQKDQVTFFYGISDGIAQVEAMTTVDSTTKPSVFIICSSRDSSFNIMPQPFTQVGKIQHTIPLEVGKIHMYQVKLPVDGVVEKLEWGYYSNKFTLLFIVNTKKAGATPEFNPGSAFDASHLYLFESEHLFNLDSRSFGETFAAYTAPSFSDTSLCHSCVMNLAMYVLLNHVYRLWTILIVSPTDYQGSASSVNRAYFQHSEYQATIADVTAVRQQITVINEQLEINTPDFNGASMINVAGAHNPLPEVTALTPFPIVSGELESYMTNGGVYDHLAGSEYYPLGKSDTQYSFSVPMKTTALDHGIGARFIAASGVANFVSITQGGMLTDEQIAAQYILPGQNYIEYKVVFSNVNSDAQVQFVFCRNSIQGKFTTNAELEHEYRSNTVTFKKDYQSCTGAMPMQLTRHHRDDVSSPNSDTLVFRYVVNTVPIYNIAERLFTVKASTNGCYTKYEKIYSDASCGTVDTRNIFFLEGTDFKEADAELKFQASASDDHGDVYIGYRFHNMANVGADQLQCGTIKITASKVDCSSECAFSDQNFYYQYAVGSTLPSTIIDFTEHVTTRSTYDDSCWPTISMSGSFSPEFALIPDSAQKTKSLDFTGTPGAGEYVGTLSAVFPHNGPNFSKYLKIVMCDTSVTQTFTDFTDPKQVVIDLNSGLNVVLPSNIMIQDLIGNYASCPPKEYGISTLSQTSAASQITIDSEEIIAINQVTGVITANSEHSYFLSDTAHRSFSFKVYITKYDGGVEVINTGFSLACNGQVVTYQRKDSTSDKFFSADPAGGSVSMEIAQWQFEITSDIPGCYETDFKVYASGNFATEEYVPGVEQNGVTITREGRDGHIWLTAAIDLLTPRKLMFFNGIFDGSGTKQQAGVLNIYICGGFTILLVGNDYDTEIPWMKGTTGYYTLDLQPELDAVAFDTSSNSALSPCGSPSSNPAYIDKLRVYPHDQTSSSANDTEVVQYNGVDVIGFHDTLSKLWIKRSLLTEMPDSTHDLRFSVGIYSGGDYAFQPMALTLCKKAVAEIKPLELFFEKSNGVVVLIKAQWQTPHFLLEDHCTLPAKQGFEWQVNNPSGMHEPSFSSGDDLQIDTDNLIGTVSDYSLKFTALPSVASVEFPLKIRVCPKLAFTMEKLILSVMLSDSETASSLNLTSGISSPFQTQALHSDYDYCKLSNFQIVEDPAGTVPSSSSFLARALVVTPYGINLTVSEVSQPITTTFSVRATNAYGETTSVAASLVLTQAVAQKPLPVFSAAPQTSFKVIFNEKGEPSPETISYTSPEIKDEDNSEFEAEFTYDSALAKFMTLTFSASARTIKLEVDCSKVDLKADLGSHQIKIFLKDLSQPVVPNYHFWKVLLEQPSRSGGEANDNGNSTSNSTTDETADSTSPEGSSGSSNSNDDIQNSGTSPSQPGSSEPLGNLTQIILEEGESDTKVNPAALSDEEVEEVLTSIDGFEELDSESKTLIAKIVPGIFPGISVKELFAQLRALIARRKRLAEEQKEAKEMRATVSLLDDFQMSITFSQPLIVPSDVGAIDFNKIFEIQLITALDSKVYEASQVLAQKEKRRRLQEVTEDGITFDWTVIELSSEKLALEFSFSNPEMLSTTRYGRDVLDIKIKDLSPFISAENGLPLTSEAFGLSDARVHLQVAVPPYVSPEAKAVIGTGTKSIGTMVNSVSFGNFLLGVLTSGSMQHLWGLIRAVQLIVLTALMEISFPGNAAEFYKRAILFATMDVLSGESLYEQIFVFKQTPSLSAKFEEMDFRTLTFIMNSGSFYIILVLLLIEPLGRMLIAQICMSFRRFKLFRKIGIYFHSPEPFAMAKEGSLRLFMESYFEISMCCFLNLSAFLMTSDLASFFGTADDILNSSLTFAALVALALLPLWGVLKAIELMKNPKREYPVHHALLFEEFDLSNSSGSIYQVVFLGRRVLLAAILVFMKDQVFFQCMLVSHLSLANFCYLTLFQPFKDQGSNRVEALNEFTVFLSSTIINSFLNAGTDLTFREFTGWLLVGVACANIGVNIAILGFETFKALFKSTSQWIKSRHFKGDLQARLQDWDSFSLAFPHISEETYLQIVREEEQRVFCQDWAPHRSWLLYHKIDLSEFPEESRFKESLKEFMFADKAKTQLMTKKKIELASKLQAKVVESKFKKRALLRASEAFSKKSRTGQLTKLTSIAEEEDVGTELDFVLSRPKFQSFKPTVSGVEKAILGSELYKQQASALVTELNLDFALSPQPQSESEPDLEEEAQEIFQQRGRQVQTNKLLLQFPVFSSRSSNIDSIVQALFAINPFRERILMMKEGQSKIVDELASNFDRAEEALEASDEGRKSKPSGDINLCELANCIGDAIGPLRKMTATEALLGVSKAIDEVEEVAFKTFGFEELSRVACPSKSEVCKVHVQSKKMVLTLPTSGSLQESFDKYLKAHHVQCFNCKNPKAKERLAIREPPEALALRIVKIQDPLTVEEKVTFLGRQFKFRAAVYKASVGSYGSIVSYEDLFVKIDKQSVRAVPWEKVEEVVGRSELVFYSI